MSFSLAVEGESLELAASGNVVGIVYALMNGEAFPDSQWWDFPCLVLGAWWEHLQDRASPKVSLRFMDGQATINCERRYSGAGTQLVLVPVIDSDPPIVLSESEVAEDAVVAEIRRVARIIVSSCREKGLPDQGLSRILDEEGKPTRE